MIDLLFAALFQAIAGAPEAPPEQATAETTTTQEQAAETSGAERVAERNRRRCRAQAVTGSRLASRVCLSAAEEEMLTEESRNFLTDGMRMWDNQSSPGGTLVCDRPGC